jgi:hypothetical protein
VYIARRAIFGFGGNCWLNEEFGMFGEYKVLLCNRAEVGLIMFHESEHQLLN